MPSLYLADLLATVSGFFSAHSIAALGTVLGGWVFYRYGRNQDRARVVREKKADLSSRFIALASEGKGNLWETRSATIGSGNTLAIWRYSVASFRFTRARQQGQRSRSLPFCNVTRCNAALT